VRRITLNVDAAPPIRHHDGVCADRSSPNAGALFQAATAMVAAGPDAFPIRDHVGLTIASSEPLPDIWPKHGYSVPTAMIEVLVDAGMLADERLVEWEREEVTPNSRGYSIDIYIEESRFARNWIDPISPSPPAD
jgi:hypothetical protein